MRGLISYTPRLQTTADQKKYWPAIEDAIQLSGPKIGNTAPQPQARTERGNFMLVNSAALRDRDPVKFLHRRAEYAWLDERPILMKLADTWLSLSIRHLEFRSEAADGFPYGLRTS